MGLYKFFRLYRVEKDGMLSYEKIKKLVKVSQVAVNLHADYKTECQAKIAPLFTEKNGKLVLKKGYRKLIDLPDLKKKILVSPVEVLQLGFKHASSVQILQNYFWLKCQPCRQCHYSERQRE